MKAEVRLTRKPSASATLDTGISGDAQFDVRSVTGVVSWNGETGDVVYTPPVTSVNGQTGDVSISVPTKTSDLDNDSGYVNAGQAASSAPVQSVNGQTGNVTVSSPTKTSDLQNDSGFITSSDIPVTSVNGKTGAVSLSATDVGAIPDTTTFALGYDPESTVGLAKVDDAVTDEPNYTPSGDIQQTLEELELMTGGTAELTASFYNGILTLGVSLTPTTATKNVATSAPVFVGNGVHFVIEEEP